MTDSILSLAEIEARFPGEWILLEDPTTNEALKVQGGTVLCHAKSRDEIYQKAVELKPKRFAVLFMGSLPEGTEVLV
jgi:hypothetical protein